MTSNGLETVPASEVSIAATQAVIQSADRIVEQPYAPERRPYRYANALAGDRPQRHTDIIGLPKDMAAFMGGVALEVLGNDTEATAAVIDLTFQEASWQHIQAPAKRRNIAINAGVFPPAMLLQGAAPELFGDVVRKVLEKDDQTGAAKATGAAAKKISGALYNYYCRSATLMEIDQACRYLTEEPGMADGLEENLKETLAGIWPFSRVNALADSGAFDEIIGLTETWMSQPLEPVVNDKHSRLLIMRLPPAMVGRPQMSSLLTALMPTMLDGWFARGIPSVLGVIGAQELDTKDLSEIVSLAQARRIEHTILGFDPSRTISETTLATIHTVGSLVLTRSTGPAAEMAAQLAGPCYDVRVTGGSTGTSTNVGSNTSVNGSKGSSREDAGGILPKPRLIDSGKKNITENNGWSAGSDSSRGTNETTNFSAGQVPAVEAWQVAEIPDGAAMAVVRTSAGELLVNHIYLTDNVWLPPQPTLADQIAAKLQDQGIAIPDQLALTSASHQEPQPAMKVWANPIKVWRQTEDKVRDERAAKIKQRTISRDVLAALTSAGLRFSDFTTLNGDLVAPDIDTIQKSTALQIFLSAPAKIREQALRDLAAGVPEQVVNDIIGRDRNNRLAG